MYVYVHMYFDPPCAEREGNVKKSVSTQGAQGLAMLPYIILDWALPTWLGLANRHGLQKNTHTYRVGLSQRSVHEGAVDRAWSF